MPAKPPNIAALFVAVAAWSAPASAQLFSPSTGGIVGLDFALQRLSENRRVLVIAAHPDDEDTSLLTLLARGYGVEAAYLALSRGEGGQNLIGDELGVDLGLLRAQELLAAREIDGARQFFTRAYDFGYSRSVDETSRLWLPDSILKDVVRVVRRMRPHVMVTSFSGTERDGHGQHQLAGVMARRAFQLAGDTTVFPELQAEEGLSPWTPLKLYRSTRLDPRATTLELHTGVPDPRTGRTYHQLAMASRSQHRSQDMGRLQPTGPASTRLALLEDRTGVASSDTEQALFSGIAREQSWLSRLADSLRGVIAPANLPAAARPLANALVRAQSEVLDPARMRLLSNALATSAAVVVDGRASAAVLVPGEQVPVTVEVYNAGSLPVTVNHVSLLTPSDWQVQRLNDDVSTISAGESGHIQLMVTVPKTATPTQPYFLERPLVGSLYDWSGVPPADRGRPFDSPVLQVRVALELLGARLTLEREVTYRYNDQATGEVREQLRVIPTIDVNLSPSQLVWPAAGDVEKHFTVTLTFNGGGVTSGVVQLEADGWRTPAPVAFQFERVGESIVVPIRLSRPPGVSEAQVQVRAIARADDGSEHTSGMKTIRYAHIRAVSRVIEATSEVRIADIRLPRVRLIGYVRGAADRVPEALAQVGLPLEVLNGTDLAHTDLSRFDAVVIGSRAYETDPALVRHNHRLLDYVRGGGTMIVQYQQYQFVRGEYAPYPITISRPHDRITDEDSPVVVLQPEHPALMSPNPIGPRDWEGWPQERGLYFAASWDDAYTPLVEMIDPGREAVRGGLLVAPVGRGVYVYTGISFFRSLPAGIPGAYRLFLNLLSLTQ